MAAAKRPLLAHVEQARRVDTDETGPGSWLDIEMVEGLRPSPRNGQDN